MLARTENVPKELIVHNSGDNTPAPQLCKIDNWHRDRGFSFSLCGYYVGYHYLISRDGKVAQTRNDFEEGAHCKGHNFSSLGICLEGDFDTEDTTEAQRTALGRLLVEKTRKYWIPSKKIVPHRTFGKTNCYGERLSDDWARLIYEAAETNWIYRTINHLLNYCTS